MSSQRMTPPGRAFLSCALVPFEPPDADFGRGEAPGIKPLTMSEHKSLPSNL